jgi:hypothetical protein
MRLLFGWALAVQRRTMSSMIVFVAAYLDPLVRATVALASLASFRTNEASAAVPPGLPMVVRCARCGDWARE